MTKPFELLKAEVASTEVKAIERLLAHSTTCETWMTTRVFTVKPTDSIDRALGLLKRHQINQLPVVSGRTLVGIVTDRDLREAASPHSQRQPKKERISIESVMSSPAITLARHSTLINAASVLRKNRMGSLPIAEGESLVGIVTRSDILDAFVAFANGRFGRVKTIKNNPQRRGEHL